jgi:hypothetical protein
MWEWLIPIISSAAEAGLTFFRKPQTSKYEMSPYEQKVLNELTSQYQSGEMPSSMTAPYFDLKREIKQDYGRQAGASGLESAVIQRQVTTPMAEMEKEWKSSLLDKINALTRGTGTMTQPKDYTSSFGDLGFALAMLMNKNKGGIGSLSPEEYLNLIAKRRGGINTNWDELLNPSSSYGGGIQHSPGFLGGW